MLASRLRTSLTLGIGVLLAALYLAPDLTQILKSAYFNLDDFDNLYWTQDLSLRQMLAYVIDPHLEFFRPAGMFWYWLMGLLYQLNPVPFHVLELSLNFVNVALVCLVTLVITGRSISAILISVLWITSAALLDVLWWFGSIFEIVFTAFYLAALLAFISIKSWPRKTLVVLGFYLLALKAKEMAITLPAVLLLYETLVERRLVINSRPRVIFYSILAAVSAYFATVKASSMADHDPSAPYFFSLSLQTLASDSLWYAGQLFTALSDQQSVALLLLGGLALASLMLRDRAMLFGMAFAGVAMAPVIFLPNHLFAFFWYLPSIGIWISIGQLTHHVSETVVGRMGERLRFGGPLVSACVAGAVFALAQVPARENRANLAQWTQDYAGVFRNYVAQIRTLPEPPRGATIEAQDPPRPFNAAGITMVYRVLYGRQDIRVRVARASDSSAAVSGQNTPNVVLAATPEHLTLRPDETGTATLTWDAGNLDDAELWLSANGSPEQLLTEASKGNRVVNWIRAPGSYTFRLYGGESPSGVLATVEITADVASRTDANQLP